jgi:hypothetical protein
LSACRFAVSAIALGLFPFALSLLAGLFLVR